MKITVDTHDNYVSAQITDQDLTEDDLKSFRDAVDEYTKKAGHAPNLMIQSAKLPHFPSFKAFRDQAKFAYEKSKQINKVAIVTDSVLGDVVPTIADVLAKADIKHFKMAEEQSAMDWLTAKESAEA